MADIIRGQLANIVFPMVDATDFASIESGITASDFNSAATRQYIGYNHGASATAAFSNLSKTTNLVRSGIFHHVLNETETNFDVIMVRFTHPSCADQLLLYYTESYDASDIFSQLSDIGSNLLSYLVGLSGMISDVDSQLLLNASLISDIDSQLLLNASLISDIDSQLLLNASVISDIQSALDSQFVYVSNAISDMQSNLLSYLVGLSGLISDVDSQLLLNASLISDIDSQLLVTHSLLSDVDSQVNLLATSNYLSAVHSDLRSQISGITASVGASDISDIASAVWANTIGARVDSRVLVIQSLASDIDSQLLLNASVISDIDSQLLVTHSLLSDVDSQVNLLATSNYLSAVHSDLRSQISGITASVGASDISDIASAVWANTIGARVDSRVLIIQSLASDIDSQLLLNASLISDIDSQVNLLATSNYLSTVHSDLRSQISGITASVGASDISDIASAVWANTIGARVDSRVLVIQSLASDIDSQLLLNASVISDIDSQLLLNASLISDIDSQVNLLATSNYLSAVHSDLRSQISGITASVGASDISDIASAVWANTIGARVDSRVLVIQSLASDIDSQLLLNASVISDIDSQLLVTHSLLSDVDSQVNLLATSNYLSQVYSDLYSAIGNVSVILTDSNISDIASAVAAAGLEISDSDISDIASAVWANTIGARVDSRISDIQANTVPNPNVTEFTYTVTNSTNGNPIDGVKVWITTDAAGNDPIWVGFTDAQGIARDTYGNKPWLDPATYYFFRKRSGYEFNNPDTEIVT